MMCLDRSMDDDFRVLTREAFDVVLRNELKRAVRSQNFLTLLLLQTSCTDVPDPGNVDREPLITQIARLVSRDVRETDLLALAGKGGLWIVLLDADLESALRVVARLMGHFRHYAFPRPIDIEVGAGCFPTDGADVESLRRTAELRPVVHTRCDARPNAPNGH
jgi:GGDEF domain-containing protein